MTGIRRCGKSVMLELIHPQVAPAPQELHVIPAGQVLPADESAPA